MYKTRLIGLINNTIGKIKNLTCVSRPRRFGKSFAAQMLCAYYDKTCDFHGFFNKDDVLTLLIHLGYLAYDSERENVYIPNEEIRMEFSRLVRKVKPKRH